MKPTIENLFTRPLSNEGVKADLKTPDGKPAGASVTILGQDSDTFAKARAERSRESARILSLPEEERQDAGHKANVALIASAVIAWDFEEECTPENVARLLSEAPAVYDLLSEAIANRALFFREEALNLETYAKAEFHLSSVPKGAEGSRRKQLEQVEKATGRTLPELEFSRNWQGAFKYLWQWYLEIVHCSPVSYVELSAWSAMTGRELSVFEVSLLMRLDFLNRTRPDD